MSFCVQIIRLLGFNITIPGNLLSGGNPIAVAANANATFNIRGTPRPPSAPPKTGDGFTLWQLLALMVAALAALGWLRFRKPF